METTRMSDAEIWEMLVPEMGIMAVTRNLRNFDEAGISEETVKAVCARLSDPVQVAKSKMFPYRWLSAYKAVNSVRWLPALETAMEESVKNVPVLAGRTLVLVDTSGSMQSSVGGARSQAQRYEVAALFGAVLAKRNPGAVDMSIYATYVAPWDVKPGASMLRSVEDMQKLVGSVGHGTNTWEAIQSEYKDHNRIIVLTDEQSHDSGRRPGNSFLHVINLAGYQYGTAPKDHRTFAYGGFTDKMFTLIPTMEAGSKERWPWEK